MVQGSSTVAAATNLIGKVIQWHMQEVQKDYLLDSGLMFEIIWRWPEHPSGLFVICKCLIV